MSGLNGTTPGSTNVDDEAGQDSLETLRQELKDQRSKRKACLEKHKQTTIIAVEAAKKGTTCYDPEKLRKVLESDRSS